MRACVLAATAAVGLATGCMRINASAARDIALVGLGAAAIGGGVTLAEDDPPRVFPDMMVAGAVVAFVGFIYYIAAKPSGTTIPNNPYGYTTPVPASDPH